jgi:DNA primase
MATERNYSGNIETVPRPSGASLGARIREWSIEFAGDLDEHHRDYLLSRGARRSDIERIGFFTLRDPSEYGRWRGLLDHPNGEYLHDKYAGSLVTPARGTSEISRLNLRVVEDKRIRAVKVEPVRGFAKSEAVVGFDTVAIKAALQGSAIWLCEGVYDLLALQWATDAPVLAVQTANPSNDTLDMIAKVARGRINIAFDNDPAGIKGAKQVEKALRKKGLDRVQIIPYVGKDAGEIWDNGGAESVRFAFKKYDRR